MNNNEYEKHYKEFSQNVAFVTRAWHHHVCLSNKAAEDKTLLAALNKAPRFWLDLRYSSVQTTIIFLGKIFDNDQKAFSIDKTIKFANEGKQHFSRSQIRKRKLDQAGEFEGLNEYIENVSELTNEDIKLINAQIKKAKTIWQRIKPLRDKVYAHSEIMSDEERKELYKPVKNEDIDNIIQILLNVSNVLLEAEMNGSKPDFSSDHTVPIKRAYKDIDELISSIMSNKILL